jgi:hypothetical protein
VGTPLGQLFEALARLSGRENDGRGPTCQGRKPMKFHKVPGA